jgi:hypothetical protein
MADEVGSEDAASSAQEDVMNDKERDAYARKQEQRVREDEARLAMTEARAREADATEELKELNGLKAFQTKQRDHLERFKKASGALADDIRAEFENDRKEFASRFDAIKKRFDQVDQVREKRLEAQLDQFDQEIVALDARMQTEGMDLQEEDKKELDRVKAAFRRAGEDLKRTWQRAREKVESARHGAG